MPPRKGFRRKNVMKAKINQIVKRLMEISLIVDKYIYKNRPISSEQAEMYMREVNSYQALCRHDERSLQVIEKLSRYMKAIIEEQSAKEVPALRAKDDNTDGTVFNPSVPSPVYSLQDEDQTQLDESCGLIDENIELVQDNPEKDLTTIIDRPLLMTHTDNTTESNIETTELSSDSERECQYETVDAGIVDDINSLALHDKDQSTFVQTELCSQSILNNVSLAIAYEDSSEVCGQDMNIYDREINHILNTQIPAIKEIPKTVNILTEDNDNSRKLKKPNKENFTPNNMKINNNNRATDKNKKRKTISKYISKAGNNSKEQTNKKVKKAEANDSSFQENYKNVEQTIKRKRRLNNPKCQKYCEDLSWIENIKYVREITVDECNPDMSVSDSFWDNFELPVCWDDGDFEY